MLKSLCAHLAVSLLFMISFHSFAQPTLLKKGDKVSPVWLLEFEDEPGRFLFIGKSPQQYHVFEIQNGKVSERLMIDGTVMYDGGSLNLFLEGSVRLFVPSDQKYNYVDGRQDSYLIFPDRAREKLAKRELNRTRLRSLRLSKFLEKQPKQPTAQPSEREPHQALPDGAQFILITMPSDMLYAVQRQKEEALEAALATDNLNACFTIQPRRQFYQGTFLVACPPEKASAAVAALSAIGDIQVLHIHRDTDVTTSTRARIYGYEDTFYILNHKARSLDEKLLALSVLLNNRTQLRQELAQEDGNLLWNIHSTLDQLARIQEAITEALMADYQHQIVRDEKLADNWLTFENLKPRALEKVRVSELERRLLAPLRYFVSRALSQLRDLGRPELTQLILMHARNMNGAALPLLQETWNPQFPNETFFDGWLQLLATQVQFMGNYPELPSPEQLKAEKWRLKTEGGGVFEDIKLSAELVEAYQWNQTTPFQDEKISLPRMVLGEKADDRASKKKILNFIIQSDRIIAPALQKISEAQAFVDFIRSMGASEEAVPFFRQFWRNGSLGPEEIQGVKAAHTVFADASDSHLLETLRNGRRRALAQSTKYDGHVLLTKFMTSLTWRPPFSDLRPGYSDAVYYANVIDILVELLESSEDVISTQGTYLSTLDAAVGLQNRLRDGDLVPLSEDLKAKVQYLGQVLQRKLLQPLPMIQRKLGEDRACDIMLSPNPRKTALGF